MAGARPLVLRTLLTLRLALLVLCAAVSVAAHASVDDSPVERAVKVAYLYKFLGYVNWPPQAFSGPGDPYVIGVAADSAVLAALSEVASSRQVRGRRIVVRPVNAGDALEGLHVLYVAQPGAAAELLRRVRTRPVLTVVDGDAGPDSAVIRFRLIDDRVRFDISLAAAHARGLELSSRLLAVAHKVEGSTQ